MADVSLPIYCNTPKDISMRSIPPASVSCGQWRGWSHQAIGTTTFNLSRKFVFSTIWTWQVNNSSILVSLPAPHSLVPSLSLKANFRSRILPISSVITSLVSLSAKMSVKNLLTKHNFTQSPFGKRAWLSNSLLSSLPKEHACLCPPLSPLNSKPSLSRMSLVISKKFSPLESRTSFISTSVEVLSPLKSSDGWQVVWLLSNNLFWKLASIADSSKTSSPRVLLRLDARPLLF